LHAGRGDGGTPRAGEPSRGQADRVCGMTTCRTNYRVDGTYAQRSAAAPRSSPTAAQRCAEGAGLDGGDRGRSTIKDAVLRAICTYSIGAAAPIGISTPSRIHTSLTHVTGTDGKWTV
ncbi:MAG TPA: hypothetical protein VGY66_20820, partial [Gemmataceae bacterium]|nr:hypothetical protein [Gemmataceae bacterium]